MEILSPIFIISNRRSGSTLLRLMLTSHPNIVIPPEGDFLVQLGWKFDRRKLDESCLDDFVDELFKMENILDWEFDKNSLLERLHAERPQTYPELIGQLYLEYDRIKNNSASRRWGDKTTWYAVHLTQIYGYFPDLQVIHLVRDPRAVVASYKDVPHLPSDVTQAGLDWLWHEHQILRSQRSIPAEQWYQIRYEDLVLDPQNVLESICNFIGEAFHPAMLNYWQRNKEERLEPERHMKWKRKTLQKVTTSQIERWKQCLTDHEQHILNQLTYQVCRKYGYEMDDGRPSLPITCYWSLRKGFKLLQRSILEKMREVKARFLASLELWT